MVDYVLVLSWVVSGFPVRPHHEPFPLCPWHLVRLLCLDHTPSFPVQTLPEEKPFHPE